MCFVSHGSKEDHLLLMYGIFVLMKSMMMTLILALNNTLAVISYTAKTKNVNLSQVSVRL